MWRHESHQWRPYTAEASRQLTYAKSYNMKVVLLQGSNGNAYLVDLENNMQYNEKTSTPKRVLPPS